MKTDTVTITDKKRGRTETYNYETDILVEGQEHEEVYTVDCVKDPDAESYTYDITLSCDYTVDINVHSTRTTNGDIKIIIVRNDDGQGVVKMTLDITINVDDTESMIIFGSSD